MFYHLDFHKYCGEWSTLVFLFEAKLFSESVAGKISSSESERNKKLKSFGDTTAEETFLALSESRPHSHRKLNIPNTLVTVKINQSFSNVVYDYHRLFRSHTLPLRQTLHLNALCDCNQNALWPCFIFSHYCFYCYCCLVGDSFSSLLRCLRTKCA